MTSRSALDARYGRQGGRVVSWDGTPPHPQGARLRLVDELGGASVTVVEPLDRNRYRVRFDSGAELIVPATDTRTVTEEAHHGQTRHSDHDRPALELDL